FSRAFPFTDTGPGNNRASILRPQRSQFQNDRLFVEIQDLDLPDGFGWGPPRGSIRVPVCLPLSHLDLACLRGAFKLVLPKHLQRRASSCSNAIWETVCPQKGGRNRISAWA